MMMIRYWIFAYFHPPNANILIVSIGHPTIRKKVLVLRTKYFQDIKMFLESKGYVFESETDTECIAKLVKHIRSQNPSYTFRQLVEQTISQVRNNF